MEALQAFSAKFPTLAELVSQIESYHSKKLYHNLLEKLEELVQARELEHKGDDLLQLHEQFISKFDTRLNFLKYALIITAISNRVSDPRRALTFLENVYAKVEKDKRKDRERVEALVILKVETAMWQLKLQDFAACKQLLQEAKEAIDKEGYVDTSVNSAFYRVKSEYLKRTEDLNEFYKNSLLYLAYTPIETIPLIQQQAIAFDIGIAALLGDKVYNFGELLGHPVVESLHNTQAEWLTKLLFAFNKGDIEQYKQLCQTYGAQIESRPILKARKTFLDEKIQLMTLMELVFQRSAGNRTITFADVAKVTGRSLIQVELLLLKALAFTLIKGVIDEVAQTIQVTWVQPRVLDKNQIASLRDKVGAWVEKTNGIMSMIQPHNETK